MTVGKASLLTAGLVATFALGVESGPTIRNSWSQRNAPEAAVTTQAVEQSTPAPVKAARPIRRPSTSSRSSEPVGTKKPANAIQTIEVSLWEPELRNRVKTVLTPGAHLDIAAADFDSSEQFVTVAHAARNTNVPFMVLKDRVLNQGKSLADAIRESKPDVDAKAEVTRARSEARSDLDITG